MSCQDEWCRTGTDAQAASPGERAAYQSLP
jgi:hypothetical protein